ncbi:MAG TPA: DUF4149 domain-containing protein [Candidatus Acidoferrales bacterium]|nr:DUF4149 domain-containing protein [Candidatus Acidoferrales bacterium]
MTGWIGRSAPIVLALWSGMQLTVGYAVAPLLFARLADPVLAGAVAGELFRFVFVAGVPALLWARWALPGPARWPHRLLEAALVILILQAAALQPLMAHFKALGPDSRSSFLVVHGLSQLLYAAVSVMVLMVLFERTRRD